MMHSFGQQSCYPVAFGLPALLMIVAIVIFICGRDMYIKDIKTEGTVILQVFRVLRRAVEERKKALDKTKPLIDYARNYFSDQLVRNVKDLFGVLTVLIPTPLFWALYDQQGSRWTYQAIQMNPRIFRGHFTIKPEQMQTINAIMILVSIPLFDKLVYPTVRRMGINWSPLRKMSAGMWFAVCSFLFAAILQYQVEKGVFETDSIDTEMMVCTMNCTNILWQIPQYLMITWGEIMFSITGLEFAYSQAPASMKSFCQSFWLMTVAIGNLLVILLTAIDPFKRLKLSHQSLWNYLLYAGILTVGTFIFTWGSSQYKYKEEIIIIVDEHC